MEYGLLKKCTGIKTMDLYIKGFAPLDYVPMLHLDQLLNLENFKVLFTSPQ
jgi:hypothetical protein